MTILVGGQGCPKFLGDSDAAGLGGHILRDKGPGRRDSCVSMVTSVLNRPFVLPEAEDSGLGLWDRAEEEQQCPLEATRGSRW